MTVNETFAVRRKRIDDMVAERRYEQSKRVDTRFEGEPYNAEKNTPEERREAYAAIREDAMFLAERHNHFAKLDQLPPGVLHRGYLEDLRKAEKDWQDHQRPNNPRPVDLTFPTLAGPLEAGGE
jgi:hypothetical protein